MQTQISANTSGLSQEVTNRANADAGLQTQITANTTALTTKADLVGGKVPTAQLPSVTIGETFTVASQAAMLALTAQNGDVAIRTDLGNRKFLLTGGDSSVLDNWIEIGAADAVSSVNGQTGAVVLSAANVGAATASHTHSTYETHIANLNNPHAVTAAQIGALTQSQGDARYQLAASVPSYPTTNLVHDFRLIGNLANSVNAFTPAQFAGALLKHNPYIPTGIATRTNGSGLVIFPSTFSLTSGRSIHIVMRVQQLTAWTNFLGETNTGLARGIDLMVNPPNQWYVVVGDDVGYVTGVFGTISLNTWLCVTLIYSVGSGVTIAVNNVVLGTVSTTKVLTATTSTLGGYIKDDGIGGQYSAAQYATVLQYSATHDSTQRTAVYNGLKADLASRGVVLP